MQIAPGTATRARQIGAKDGPVFTVQVPTPYAAGYVCDESHAAILNQTLSENISNNLRQKLIDGVAAVTDEAGNVTSPARPYTDAEAQALVDTYVSNYEPGVRRGGGEARIVDPIEREALAIAREKAREFIKSKGGKAADYDVPMLAGKILEGNRDFLMAEAAKIVKARQAASKKSEDGLSFEGLDLTPKAPAPAAS